MKEKVDLGFAKDETNRNISLLTTLEKSDLDCPDQRAVVLYRSVPRYLKQIFVSDLGQILTDLNPTVNADGDKRVSRINAGNCLVLTHGVGGAVLLNPNVPSLPTLCDKCCCSSCMILPLPSYLE